MSRHAHSRRSHCQNCGALLHGPYCSQCGQHDVDYSGSFWHIMEDALEGALHFDGKFFRSARFIFTRPGFLTKEFRAGRRERYMHPVRLYVFASFLFFAASVLLGHNRASGGASKAAASDSSAASAKESWLDNPLRITADPTDKVSDRDLANEVWHLLAAMLILCLLLLALVLKLVYLKARIPYLEHLIFALHVQALAFLSFLLIKAGGMLGSLVSKEVESVVGLILLLGMFWLVYRAFLEVYREGWFKTAFKFVLVLGGHGVILLVALVAVGTASTYLVSRGSP